jgi:kumamolisin
VGTVIAGLLVAAACAGPPPAKDPFVKLPAPTADVVTFAISLPGPTGGAVALAAAGQAAGDPSGPAYRHFSTVADAAARYGATDAQIDAVGHKITDVGLTFTADPTRLFGRVTGTPKQWEAALGAPLQEQAATVSSPFRTYALPNQVPPKLTPENTTYLIGVARVHEPALEGPRPPGGRRAAFAADGPTRVPADAQPFPLNTGTPLQAACSSSLLTSKQVYTPQQVHTAYGITQAASAPVITVLDLGGGWLTEDLQLAGECFGFTPPQVAQSQGDGVAASIANADGETSLDLQTVSAVVPGATLRVVQAADGGGALLDAFSRAIDDPAGPPDVMTLSYGGCAIAERQEAPAFVAAVEGVLAMAALAGVSTFVAAGDSGSTTCPSGAGVAGTSLSYPAVSTFATAVGGTRLALGQGNARAAETVWNDTDYGQKAAGGGGVSAAVPRPHYQDKANTAAFRALPDLSALADISPGWPVVTDSSLQTVGGTSGAAPLTAAAAAQVAGAERAAGRPPLGLVNGWVYAAAASHPDAFFDVVQGENDLGGVGCCTARAGYDTASGLGVPNWSVLPTTLPPPA